MGPLDHNQDSSISSLVSTTVSFACLLQVQQTKLSAVDIAREGFVTF